MKIWSVAWAVAIIGVASLVGARDITNDKLKIVDGVCEIDPSTNYVKIRGEVWNNSGKWIRSVDIKIQMFDASGKPITVSGFLAEQMKSLGRDASADSVIAERFFVPPGEVAVFERLRDPAKLGAKYASHKLTAEAWAVTGTPPKMAIDNLKTGTDEFGYYEVSGTIRNVGTVPCRSPKAVLAFYTADGKVQHATYEGPDEYFQKHLAPGASVAFSRKNIIDGKGAKSVKAWGDCSDPE
ncbi:MAG: hypothetical protein MUF51_03350 [Vicinamibacteria bacterium]|jgi:hypothetical protein|nr:hypothetical protein [Vicinamibacteria bacterium]